MEKNKVKKKTNRKTDKVNRDSRNRRLYKATYGRVRLRCFRC